MVSRENVEATEALQDESVVPGDWSAAMVIDEEKCIRCGLCGGVMLGFPASQFWP